MEAIIIISNTMQDEQSVDENGYMGDDEDSCMGDEQTQDEDSYMGDE